MEGALRRSFEPLADPLYDLLRYHLGWTDPHGQPAPPGVTGKALRPALCLWACEAVGGEVSQALPAAVGLELLHDFSLIHDDIQDQDRERHHRPTVWALWGQARALIAGDALRILAEQALLAQEGHHPPLPHLLRAADLFARRCQEMIEGQYLDVAFEERLDVTTEDYLHMVGKKTGALFAGAMELGALLGGGNQAVVAAFGQCGRLLGTLYQVQDDVLGIWGPAEATGKGPGSDIRRKKKTFPIVYALEHAPPTVTTALRHLYQQPTLNDTQAVQVVKLLEGAGVRRKAQEAAAEMGHRSRKPVSQLGLASRYLREYEELVRSLLERQS